MYECYICGKKYNTPIEAAECVFRCNDKKKLEQEREDLRTEITIYFTELRGLCAQYSDIDPDIDLKVNLNVIRKNSENSVPDKKDEPKVKDPWEPFFKHFRCLGI